LAGGERGGWNYREGLRGLRMGIFQNAWSRYKLAKERLQELEKGFAGIGLVDPEILDTKFTKAWVREAIETDAATVIAKFSPVIRQAMSIAGRRVNYKFNQTVIRLLDARRSENP
jgi:hypothetical protein